jgi:hypothetical protein
MIQRLSFLKRLKEAFITVSGVALLMGVQWTDCELARREVVQEEQAFHALMTGIEEGRVCAGDERLTCAYQSVEKLSLHHFPLDTMARRLTALTQSESERAHLSPTNARRRFQIWFLDYGKRELDYRRAQLGLRVAPKQRFTDDREALKDFLKVEVDAYFSEDRSAQRSPAENPGIEDHWNAVAHFRAELFKPVH